MSRVILSVAALLMVSVPGDAAEPTLSRYRFSEPHMGTMFQIIVYAADEATAAKAVKAAFARIADLDGSMSDYRDSSELMRLCAKAGGDPVKVSDDLFFVLSRARKVSELSDGAFDVTVGPIVRLWRLARRTRKLPDAEDLTKARALVGYKMMKLDPKAKTVQLEKRGMRLDLGGIAKGFAADEALKVLKKHGIDRALVAAGGDIAVSRPPPETDGWKVEIAPLKPGGNSPGALLLKDAAVSTSGDAEQYVEIDGKRYSHIVDPRTGIGLIGRMSVTVVAPNGTTSDSLTKVVAVLGPERGMKVLETQEGVSARMVRLEEDGKAETFLMKNFPKLLPTSKD
jgi:thiamine biosynthesis lipoprotein